jgi:hypothetical protein
MSPSKLPKFITLAFLATAATAAIAGDARAQSCGMGEVDWYSIERQNVATADDLLQRGEPEKAAWLLQRTWPRLHEAVPVKSSLPHIAEGVRLMALASVRSEGRVRSANGWSSWSPLERSLNVTWGVQRLRMLTKADPSNTVAKTDLGEALSRAPATRDEARVILEALDASHAVATPEGYAALAMLRSSASDASGAMAASAACQHAAQHPDVQCAAAVTSAPTLTAAR